MRTKWSYMALYIVLGLGTVHCGSTTTGSAGTEGGNLSTGDFFYSMGGAATGEEAGSGSYAEGDVDGDAGSTGGAVDTGGAAAPGSGTGSYDSPITDDSGAISIYVSPGKCEKAATKALVRSDVEEDNIDNALEALMNEETSGVLAVSKSTATTNLTFSAPPGSFMKEDDEDKIVIFYNLTSGQSVSAMAKPDGSLSTLSLPGKKKDLIVSINDTKMWMEAKTPENVLAFVVGHEASSETCTVTLDSEKEEFVIDKIFQNLDMSQFE